MAEVPVGNLPDRVGNTEEQRTIGSHVPVDSYASIYVLSAFRSQDRIPKTLRATTKSRTECGQIPITDACHQLE